MRRKKQEGGCCSSRTKPARYEIELVVRDPCFEHLPLTPSPPFGTVVLGVFNSEQDLYDISQAQFLMHASRRRAASSLFLLSLYLLILGCIMVPVTWALYHICSSRINKSSLFLDPPGDDNGLMGDQQEDLPLFVNPPDSDDLIDTSFFSRPLV